MATNVSLPALGESVTEGTITQWLKEVGDTVAIDEPLLEVSTDKVDTEIPSPVAGTLLEIKAAEDETVEVGAVLAVIGDEGESADEAEGETEAGAEPADDEGSDEAEPDPVSQPEDEPTEATEAPTETSQEPSADAAEETGGEEKPEADTKPASGSTEGTAVVLPALGESVTEGTVTQWLKAVGDEVAVDEPLLEVSTDKVDTEIPSPVAGTLLEIKVDEDETVEVGAELAVIGTSGSSSSESNEAPDTDAAATDEPATDEPQTADSSPAPAVGNDAEAPPSTPTQKSDDSAKPDSETTKLESAPAPARTPDSEPEKKSAANLTDEDAKKPASGDSEAYVTPIVRKLAKQYGVELGSLKGTGVGGRIRKQDVLDAAPKKEAEQKTAETSATPAPKAETSALRGKTEKLTRLRKTIATRMVESLKVSAQLTTVVEVDVTEIARIRDRHKVAFAEREGVKLSYLPFFAKAAIEALKVYPQVNSSLNLDEGTVTYPAGEHLGIAVDTERGLLVPVIKDAGDLSIPGLARKIADVAERTRTNKIAPDDLSGGTFTLTNTGSRGSLFDTPIINQPQSAILGTGAVVKRPVVISDDKGGESIAVRHMAYFALTYDHRIVDGADAARFLTTIKERLEAGVFESDLG